MNSQKTHFPIRSLVCGYATLLSLGLGGTACVSYSPLEGQASEVARLEVPSFPYGHWISVQTDDPTLSGELLAVVADSLWLIDATNQVHQLQKAEVRQAQLWIHRDEAIGVERYTRGMTASAITHGWGMVLTIPMWTITRRILVNRAENQVRKIAYPQLPWQTLQLYSRFPQGIPVAVDLSSLTIQPVSQP